MSVVPFQTIDARRQVGDAFHQIADQACGVDIAIFAGFTVERGAGDRSRLFHAKQFAEVSGSTVSPFFGHTTLVEGKR